ncbi:MAG: GWxTD domain-containing protein [Bacteroidota bacterium]
MTKKHRLFLFVLFSFAIVGCSVNTNSFRECYSIAQFKQFSTPYFDSYIMNVRGNGMSRIDIYSQVKYRNLRFEKDGNGFKSSYTMRYIVRDSADAIVTTAEVDRPINVRTYEESTSMRSDAFLQSFHLSPGRYVIEMESIDDLSRYRSRSQTNFTAADYSGGSVSASSLLFLNTMISGGKNITIRPVLPVSVSLLTDSIGIFQELYNIRPNDTIRILQKYYRPDIDTNVEDNEPFLMPPYRTHESACALLNSTPYFIAETTITAFTSGTFQSIHFYPLPEAGYSVVDREVIVTRDGAVDTLKNQNELFRRERKTLNSVTVDEEVAALRYILRGTEYDSLTFGDAALKGIRINAFWQQRGGNDKRKEFLKKVTEANALFTSCEDGSRTAMGIVYIVCGTPDMIDCKGDFTESWYYNIGERTYSVEYRSADDKNHTFELVPFSVSDILWQYSLDQWRRKR